MKSHTRNTAPQEIELKLSLPGADPAGLAKHLAGLPLLAGRQAVRLSLYNIYYDTPEQALRQQRVALRLRRVGSAASPQWLQTLKTGASDASALSRRGEWETAVAGAALDRGALRHTAWADIDPDGRLFDQLAPCFVTVFERTTWQVGRPDGSVVEVALDIGHIEAGDRQAPICELELELKAGQPAALFEMARDIARLLAVLPASQSKAQRGFLLAQNSLDQPQYAQAPRLNLQLSRPELAQCVLREMFAQFTQNLNALATSDDPEVVHQARVGWRRFRSALRLFKKIPGVASAPAWPELQTLLSCLGELRNLEVALTETLPPLANGFALGDVQRADSWQAMTGALANAVRLAREAARSALQQPGVGAHLLAMTEWLENLPAVVAGSGPRQKSRLRRWAMRRIVRLLQRLELAQQQATSAQQQHQLRIVAKRLRYAVEALRDLLPRRLARLCSEQAVSLQSSIGATRDLAQASALVATLDVDRAVVEFMRGVVAGSSLVSLPG
ncbi:MAG: CHAD domain-containing protein [Rhodoferax sp.]